MAAATPPPEDPPPRLARLPTGRHGLPREFVAANHRDRLLAGCFAAVGERGYAEFTVADVIKRAAVSRRTFYEHFEDREECFLAAYDLLSAHVRGLGEEAVAGEDDWARGVKAAFVTIYEFFAGEPQLARFLLVEPLVAGGAVAAHHEEKVAVFAEVVRAAAPEEVQAEPGTERPTVAGIASLVSRRVAAGDLEQIGTLLPDLVESYLAPFVGAAEAERIARE